jgi:hypothetical protein
MKFISYNKEMRSATGQLLDVFDNIRIKRVVNDETGTPIGVRTINVPCVYGPRSRVLKSLENRNATLKVPLTCLSMTGLSWDQSRVHSVNKVLEFKEGSNINLDHNIATPITITYSFSIVAKYMKDLEQILSNFIAIMNPDIYITWVSPIGNVKSRVTWEGNIALDNAENIEMRNPYRLTATTNFIVKTWIFPGESPTYDSDVRIKSINWHNYDEDEYLAENVFGKWYDNKTYSESMDDFYDLIKEGKIQAPNFDSFSILDSVSGIWLDNLFGIISGNVYDFSVSGDLIYLFNNYDDPNLSITSINEDGIHITPTLLNDGTSVNWRSVWARMISGDLSFSTSSTDYNDYNYLVDENGVFILYENERLIPIVDD